ncbi:hypothetical protein V6N11_005179 [Hibiscus sabdariffa]|uniref:Uncharacterized protein n=1 Tax=Hibiscus sabdariffa TaxID=183260 RepID=A0ABR2RM09_9ROSI
MPTLCQQEAELLILTVLRRIDPYIEDILFTAAHVASISYEFKVDLSQWSRKDIEGSLFVVKRNTQPRFRFIVMNRWNTDVFSRIDAYSKVPQVTSTNAADVPDSLAFLKLFNQNRCLLEGAADVFSRIDAYSKVPQVTSTNAADVPDSLAFLKLFNEMTASILSDESCLLYVFSRIDAYSKVPQVTSTNAADVSDSLAFLKLFNSIHRFLHIISLSAKMNEWILVVYLIRYCIVYFGIVDVFSRIDAYSKVPQVTSTNAADVPDSLAFLKLFNSIHRFLHIISLSAKMNEWILVVYLIRYCIVHFGIVDVFSRIDAYSKVPQVTSTNAADVPDSLAFLKLFNSIHRFLHIISLSAKMNEWILVVYLIRYCIVHFGIVDVFSRIDAYSKVPQVTSTNAADVPDSLAFLKLFNSIHRFLHIISLSAKMNEWILVVYLIRYCIVHFGIVDVFSRIDAYSKVPQVTSTNAADVPDSLAFLKLFNTAMTIGSASNTAN